MNPTNRSPNQQPFNPAIRDELKYLRAELKKRDDELAAARAGRLSDRAEAQAQLQATNVGHVAASVCVQANLLPAHAQEVVERVNKQYSSFRPTPEQPHFDVRRITAETIAEVDKTKLNPFFGRPPVGVSPHGYVIDRAEEQRQRELYQKELRRLGLQDPSHPIASCNV